MFSSCFFMLDLFPTFLDLVCGNIEIHVPIQLLSQFHAPTSRSFLAPSMRMRMRMLMLVLMLMLIMMLFLVIVREFPGFPGINKWKAKVKHGMIYLQFAFALAFATAFAFAFAFRHRTYLHECQNVLTRERNIMTNKRF